MTFSWETDRGEGPHGTMSRAPQPNGRPTSRSVHLSHPRQRGALETAGGVGTSVGSRRGPGRIVGVCKRLEEFGDLALRKGNGLSG